MHPIHCPKCKLVLGQCTSRQLQIGNVVLIMQEKALLRCVACGAWRKWEPLRQGHHDLSKPVLAEARSDTDRGAEPVYQKGD